MGESVSTESQSAKNFGSWILFPPGLRVKRKSGTIFGAVSCSYAPTCSSTRNLTMVARGRKRPRNSLRISFQDADIRQFTKTRSGSIEVQADHRFGFFPATNQAHQHPGSAHQEAGQSRKQQQYPNEFKDV